MNERILELAKQAGLKKEHGSDREYIGDFDWREFADSIVRECQFAIVSRTDLPKHERKLYNNVLKEHFGVE